MSFPNVNHNNVTEVTVTPEFSTIRSEFEGGYEQTRERHSRNRYTITAKYFVDAEDKNLLLEHYNTVRGSVEFIWTNPDDLTEYTVRYDKAPKIPAKGSRYGWYEITLYMREV